METELFSDIDQGDGIYPTIREYVVEWVRNPDPGSEFDRRTRKVRRLSDQQMLNTLLNHGYDMFIDHGNGRVYGHFAFQRQRDGVHVFSISTTQEQRTEPLTILNLTRSFLDYAKGYFSQARLSGGGDEKIESLLKFLKSREEKYGLSVDLDTYWIYFVE